MELAERQSETRASPAMSARRLAEQVGDLVADRPPLYAALAAHIRLLVGDGRLPVGVRLPAERDLAAALHVSRATVAAAYRRLREDGWADARQGSGTWTRLPAGPAPSSWLPGPTPPGVLDLSHAAPIAPPQVPAAFAAALADLPRHLPGNGYHPQGLPELRERIAARYTAQGLPTIPAQVLVTHGALHAVSLALAALLPRGRQVLVEHPTYPNALDAVRGAGGRAMPVAVDARAAHATARDLLRAARAATPAAAYVMPHFQNPTGALLDSENQRRLATGLGRLGIPVIIDETMREVALDVGTPPPFPAGAATGNAPVVTVGSLSKAVWGGLRIGWLRADPALVTRLAGAGDRTGMGSPVLEQLAAARLVEDLDEVLDQQCARLRQRRDALLTAVRRELPSWEVHPPAGGLVLWCETAGVSSSALVSAAMERDVLLAAGPRFGTGHAFDDRLRLPYTQPVEVLERGVAVLADVARDLPRRPKRLVRPVPDELVV